MSQDKERTKELLNDSYDWPAVFMFKFVVPSKNEKIARIEALFSTKTAEIRMRTSAKGNYTSVTVKEVMVSADAVLDVYEEAGKIEGLISL